MKQHLSKTEQACIKKFLSLPDKQFEEELFIILNVDKHSKKNTPLGAIDKKRLQEIDKNINIKDVISRANTLQRVKKKLSN